MGIRRSSAQAGAWANTGVAAASRDHGLRRVSRLTWRAGAVAAVSSALIAAAFGHGVRHSQPARSGTSPIVIPAHPPKLSHGAGQVTSGAS
jgi:hypothetical protein